MPHIPITGISISGYLDTHLGHAGEAFAENLMKLLKQIAPDTPVSGAWEIREYTTGVFALVLPISTPITLQPPQGASLEASVEAASLIANILLLNETPHPGRAPLGTGLESFMLSQHPESSCMREYLRCTRSLRP